MFEVTYVSLGENFLIDEILKDFKLRKETFPFGSGRFNIEYINQICQEDFQHFLDDRYLKYAIADNIQVVKNTYYPHEFDIYEFTVCDGVEFTHHDVFQPQVKESMQRKVDRFKEAVRQPQSYVFLYYYRYSEKRNVSIILSQLEHWVKWVETLSGVTPKLIFIHQQLVQEKSQRNFETRSHYWGKEVVFYTQEIWTGNDNWAAAPDRDLLEDLFNAAPFMKFIYGDDWRKEKWRRQQQKIRGWIPKVKFTIKKWMRLQS